MLDTNITLIEYIALKAELYSVKRLATGRTTKWTGYESIVSVSALFDYGDGELKLLLQPNDDPLFLTIGNAKSYCRGLIEAEQPHFWLLLTTGSTPNGWSNSALKRGVIYRDLFANTTINVMIDARNIKEETPEEQSWLNCTASLSETGKIKDWSYNL
jgi:hypothetical protein